MILIGNLECGDLIGFLGCFSVSTSIMYGLLTNFSLTHVLVLAVHLVISFVGAVGPYKYIVLLYYRSRCTSTPARHYTGWSIWLGLRNGAGVSLFWYFWGPKWLLCNPKTGRKLLLGQKLTHIYLKNCQEGG